MGIGCKKTHCLEKEGLHAVDLDPPSSAESLIPFSRKIRELLFISPQACNAYHRPTFSNQRLALIFLSAVTPCYRCAVPKGWSPPHRSSRRPAGIASTRRLSSCRWLSSSVSLPPTMWGRGMHKARPHSILTVNLDSDISLVILIWDFWEEKIHYSAWPPLVALLPFRS